MPKNTVNEAEKQNHTPAAAEDPAAAQNAKIPRGDELVEVELFYDGDKYKEPVPVIVNGVKLLVPRGKPVKIKRKYAEALDHSLSQDKKAGLLQARMAADFARETESLGLKNE